MVPISLNSDAYTFVDRRQVVSDAGVEQQMPVKRQCMHCLHPACVSACTVGALTKSADGPVVYNDKKCIGCRYCQYACPFGVPTYDWENPLGLIHKCQFCISRLDEGQSPACVAGCPTGALRFGRRNTLLAQAHAQIGTNPGRYVEQVYGEAEAGGTSVLYLSGVPFAAMGLPALDSQATLPLCGGDDEEDAGDWPDRGGAGQRRRIGWRSDASFSPSPRQLQKR